MLNKLLPLLAFSVLLLVPFGVQESFALPPTITVQDQGANVVFVATDNVNELGFIQAEGPVGNLNNFVSANVDCQSSVPQISFTPPFPKTDLPAEVTAENCNSPPEQIVVFFCTNLSIVDTIEACTPQVVGGELIPIEQTSLILAGAQSFSWMIPVVLSVLGIGLFVVSRKPE